MIQNNKSFINISVKNFKFSRDEIKISANDTIQWNIEKNVYKHKTITGNRNYIIIQIMLEEKEEEELATSKKLIEKENFVYKFTNAGIYLVSVLNHPNIHQRVIVRNNKNKIFNSKNQSIIKTRISLENDCSDKFTIFSKENNENKFTFKTDSSTKEKNEDDVQIYLNKMDETYKRSNETIENNLEEEIPNLQDKETDLNTFNKIVETFKISKINGDSLFKIYENIKSYEFKKEEIKFNKFNDLITFFNNTNDFNFDQKINDNIYNDVDKKYFDIILNMN